MDKVRELQLVPDSEVTYALDCMQDLSAVRRGEKPLVIVSAGKSVSAYNIAATQACADDNLDIECAMLTCEDGQLHEHAFICLDGAPYAREAKEYIYDAVQETPSVTRIQLQARLGGLLGFGAREILDFVKSDIAAECLCDCCGGPETARPIKDGIRDQQVRRTMVR